MKKFKLESIIHSDYQIVDFGYTEELEPRTYKEFLQWIELNYNGPLNYLADHRKDIRKSLKDVYSDCESSLVFLFDYRSSKKFIEETKPKNKIASYTVGFEDQDYHFWIKEKLERMGRDLQAVFNGLEFKLSLDIHPVLERDLAERAGLGWFGKNSMIINQKFGSYNLIGSLLLNQKLPLNFRPSVADHCGNCTRCLDACPTNAILDGSRTIDSSKCISTFTIELFKDSQPPTGYPSQENEVFGCDICQEVCPWNIKPMQTASKIESSDLVDFFNRDLSEVCCDIEAMSNKNFKTFFKSTSFERVGKRGLLKNLKYYLESSKD